MRMHSRDRVPSSHGPCEFALSLKKKKKVANCFASVGRGQHHSGGSGARQFWVEGNS